MVWLRLVVLIAHVVGKGGELTPLEVQLVVWSALLGLGGCRWRGIVMEQAESCLKIDTFAIWDESIDSC